MSNTFWRRNGGPPAILPFDATDADGQHWTDLANSPEGRAACGFVPGPAEPVAGEAYDPATHSPRWDGDAEAWVLDARPPPPPPAPRPPQVLGKLTFIMLVQQVGGMTDELFEQASDDPTFKAFWRKFQMAESVERDHPVTTTALAALAQAGYLPEGAAAVTAAWPTA